MMAAEYASPIPGRDFKSSADADLISISLLEVEPLDAGLLVLALEFFGLWYGAPTSARCRH